MFKRYSKKRQGILEYMRGTDAHPSAETVYQQLKPFYPDLSLATVYRNIRELMRVGEVRSVGVVQGKERFDARTEPHMHAVCARCGKILDLDATPPEEIGQVPQLRDFSVAYAEVRFVGLCSACREKADPDSSVN